MSNKTRVVVSAVVLTVVTSVGIVYWNDSPTARISYAAESGGLPTREQLSHADALSDAFNSVAESLQPSVVTISSVRRAQRVQLNQLPGLQRRGQSPQFPRGIPEEFRRFFEEDLLDRFGQSPDSQSPGSPAPFQQRGMGSGVIVSADGYVLTNNHVVREADEVTVVLFDDREVSARLVGSDEKTDLAVLKVDVNGLVPAKLGDSDRAKVGQWVLAIGSPFELQQTVTAGIISAKSRETGILREGYEDFLQTDAAINPGNSGGPLVNLRGEVIGINTAIFSRGGMGNVGVGFAIPSNMARNVMESIIKTGKVVRGFLGAGIQPLDEGLAESWRFQGTRGVLIANVMNGSPAAKAGIQEGDIVTKLDGRTIASVSQLRNSVAALAPNTKVSLSVFREGKERTVQVTIGELPSDATAAIEPATKIEPATREAARKLGLEVAALTRNIAQQIGHQGELKGVVVASVEPGSVAAGASLRPGDVIIAIGENQVVGTDDYSRAVESIDLKAGVRLQVVREGFKRFVFIKDAG